MKGCFLSFFFPAAFENCSPACRSGSPPPSCARLPSAASPAAQPPDGILIAGHPEQTKPLGLRTTAAATDNGQRPRSSFTNGSDVCVPDVTTGQPWNLFPRFPTTSGGLPVIFLIDEKVGYLPPNFFIQKLIPLTTHCYALPLVVNEPTIIVFSFFVRGMDDILFPRWIAIRLEKLLALDYMACREVFCCSHGPSLSSHSWCVTSNGCIRRAAAGEPRCVFCCCCRR